MNDAPRLSATRCRRRHVPGRPGHGLHRPGPRAPCSTATASRRAGHVGLAARTASRTSPPKAKSVIWLFMNGGVSHLETFDPKPELTKYAGKTIAETPFNGRSGLRSKLNLARRSSTDANGQQRKTLYPLQVGFKKRGQSGIEVSDWLPHIGSCIDDIAVVRSMWTTDDNHGAQTQFHTGRHMLDGEFPTLGAWVHYGLGSLNDNLPQFVVLGEPIGDYWEASQDGHYLGPAHDGVPLARRPGNPLDFGKPERGVSREEQQVEFDLSGG